MIIRLIAVDPRPRLGESDLRVFFDAAKIEHTIVSAPERRKKSK